MCFGVKRKKEIQGGQGARPVSTMSLQVIQSELAVDNTVLIGPAVHESGDDCIPVGIGLVSGVSSQSGDNGGTPVCSV